MEPLPPDALLDAYPPPIRALAGALRSAVALAVPEAIERVRPGWRLIGYNVPVARRTAYFAFVAPQAEHVHLGFEWRAAMADPDGVLLGSDVAGQVRWLAFRPADAVDPEKLAPVIREAARVAGLSRAERLGLLAER